MIAKTLKEILSADFPDLALKKSGQASADHICGGFFVLF